MRVKVGSPTLPDASRTMVRSRADLQAVRNKKNVEVFLVCTQSPGTQITKAYGGHVGVHNKGM